MSLHRGYEPARRCTGSATPGCKALMSWFLGAYRPLGGVNTGIYNCRTVRGGATTSLHGEGRAADLGIRPYRAAYGTALAERLRRASGELGIQLIIWNERIWSGSHPDAGWRPYHGVSPHHDHLHVELSRHAAANLTVARIVEVLGRGTAPATDGTRTLELTDPRMRGADVGELQRVLNAWYPSINLERDEIYGPDTVEAVRNLQAAAQLDVDGKVGPATRRFLGIKT